MSLLRGSCEVHWLRSHRLAGKLRVHSFCGSSGLGHWVTQERFNQDQAEGHEEVVGLYQETQLKRRHSQASLRNIGRIKVPSTCDIPDGVPSWAYWRNRRFCDMHRKKAGIVTQPTDRGFDFDSDSTKQHKGIGFKKKKKDKIIHRVPESLLSWWRKESEGLSISLIWVSH